MWSGWEHGGKCVLPGRLQLQQGFPDSEIKPELFCLKYFSFLTCSLKLATICVHITQSKYRVFLKWSRSLIFSLPGVMMHFLSLQKGLNLFSRKDMHAEVIWWTKGTTSNNFIQEVWYDLVWRELILVALIASYWTACYFLVWLTENVKVWGLGLYYI